MEMSFEEIMNLNHLGQDLHSAASKTMRGVW